MTLGAFDGGLGKGCLGLFLFQLRLGFEPIGFGFMDFVSVHFGQYLSLTNAVADFDAYIQYAPGKQ